MKTIVSDVAAIERDVGWRSDEVDFEIWIGVFFSEDHDRSFLSFNDRIVNHL